MLIKKCQRDQTPTLFLCCRQDWCVNQGLVWNGAHKLFIPEKPGDLTDTVCSVRILTVKLSSSPGGRTQALSVHQIFSTHVLLLETNYIGRLFKNLSSFYRTSLEIGGFLVQKFTKHRLVLGSWSYIISFIISRDNILAPLYSIHQ